MDHKIKDQKEMPSATFKHTTNYENCQTACTIRHVCTINSKRKQQLIHAGESP